MALALPELLKNVFNFLAKDNALYPTLLVSRLWSRCTGPILWGRIKLIGEKEQEKFIKMIRINSRPIFRHSVQCFIITHHSYLSNEIIEKIVEVFPNIIHLDFERSTDFDDMALIKISQVYPNLIHLNVSNNGGLTDHSTITKIAKKCDKLQFLDIGFGGDITGKSFCEIAWSCNGLKHLGISGYRNHVTDSIVHDIARSHPNLQSIDIRSSNRLTDTAIYTLTDSCPNLRSLKLEYCDGINDIAIRKIAHCRYLEHLKLYSKKALSDKSMCIIARSCPDIQYLNLQFCNITDKAVEEIALSCHNLKHLDLFGALHISDSSISKIAKMCPNIIYLDLGYADFILDRTFKTISEYLHSLEYLGLKDCRRISQKIIDMLFPDLEIGGYYSLPLGR